MPDLVMGLQAVKQKFHALGRIPFAVENDLTAQSASHLLGELTVSTGFDQEEIA